SQADGAARHARTRQLARGAPARRGVRAAEWNEKGRSEDRPLRDGGCHGEPPVLGGDYLAVVPCVVVVVVVRDLVFAATLLFLLFASAIALSWSAFACFLHALFSLPFWSSHFSL